MKRAIKFFALLTGAISLFSCADPGMQQESTLDKIFEEQVKKMDSEAAVNQKKLRADSIERAFTEFKAAFKERFGIDVPSEIKAENSFEQREIAAIDIFSFLSFDCSDSTMQHIINTLQLKQQRFDGLKKVNCGECMPAKFQEQVKNSAVFYTRIAKPVSRYFWYDKSSKRAFYLEYELRS